MEKLTHDYRFYNDTMYVIMDEPDTLENVKTWMDGEISKDVWKKNSKSTFEWAKYAHANNWWYPITIYENAAPKCYMVNTPTTFHVKFLDERLFWYISMVYKKVESERMFLSEIWVREYMHKYQEDLHDLKTDMHFVFTPKGELSITTEKIIREPKVSIQRQEKEAAKPVNVSQNWQKIPAFGDYYYLTDYEKIIKGGDLIKEMPPDEGNIFRISSFN
jgi:hypothetical protein